jgi:GT2 family glycosyltransferase
LITLRDQYLKVGGFNEELPLNYNDVEFCAKINASGLTCVVDPEVQVYHFESATKIGTFKCEKEMLFKILPSIDDPYFNINYDQRSPYYELPKPSSVLNVASAFERALDNEIRTRGRSIQRCDVTFTVAVSVYNQPRLLLTEMLTSLFAQTYPNTEIIVHDDASTLQETIDWVDSIRENSRIKLIISKENRGISGSQRILLEHATGEYFLPVDGDDFITVDCVEIMAREAFDNPEVQVFYSDEFKSDIASNKFSPFYKSDFDHIRILNCCYVTHQMMFKTNFLREVDAYSSDEATWCHDWDSTLRTLQHGVMLRHVPELLYAWRINPGSTASAETSAKPAAIASQRFVLDRYLASCGLNQILFAEENKLGSNTGMWTICARSAVYGIVTVPVMELWQQEPENRVNILRDACEAGNYVLLLLDNTDQRTAELELSVPFHLDAAIKVVGSTLLDNDGKVTWTGGLLDGGNVIEPSCGMDPRQGGYHGLLYCQRLVDVVAGANVLIARDALLEALDVLGGTVNADRLMVMLALLARQNHWLTATTPRLEAVLLPQMRSIIPVDRDSLIQDQKVDGRSPWAGRVPLSFKA